jgi:hypothetical protein
MEAVFSSGRLIGDSRMRELLFRFNVDVTAEYLDVLRLRLLGCKG